MELNNLISMLKEFDYKKNGKDSTIKFLAVMIEYFMDVDWNK